jgi:hypothetical protein
MSLDETKGWKYVGSETTCETDGKTKDEAYSETLDEMDNKKNKKDDLEPVISMKNRIVTPSNLSGYDGRHLHDDD